MKVPKSTLLLYLFINLINIFECLLYARYHKRRFEYENDLKEQLINRGRLCSKQMIFGIALIEFID